LIRGDKYEKGVRWRELRRCRQWGPRVVQTLKVLIVDDEEELLMVLTDYCELLGMAEYGEKCCRIQCFLGPISLI